MRTPWASSTSLSTAKAYAASTPRSQTRSRRGKLGTYVVSTNCKHSVVVLAETHHIVEVHGGMVVPDEAPFLVHVSKSLTRRVGRPRGSR